MPLVQRTTAALAEWLGPAYGLSNVSLQPDLDDIPALSTEQDALWTRLEKSTFLTSDEKRAAVGYGPKPITPTVKLFSPGQLRKPPGQPGGGRWTKPGDGGGNTGPDGSSDGTPVDGSLGDNADTPSDSPDPAAEQTPPIGDNSEKPQQIADRYSPDKSGWHQYGTGPTTVCTAEENCSSQDMADSMSRHSVPGRDPANPVIDGDRTFVRDPRATLLGEPLAPGGYVVTTILDNGLTIVNQTEPLHALYDGVVVRRAEQGSDGSWSVTTYGYGNNKIPGFNMLNEWQGPKIFDFLDQQMRSDIRQRHAK